MKSIPSLKTFVFVFLLVATFSIHAESGKLLILTAGDSDKLISVDQESQTEIVFPSEFKLRAANGRVQISKERILFMADRVLNNEYLGGYEKIASYEWKTKTVAEINHPQDSGIKIFRVFISSMEDLNSSIFQEVHKNGEQRLFRLAGDKPIYLPHFDTFRKTAVLDDFLSSGAHIFRTSTKDKSVQNLESSFTGALDGFSQRLYYCARIDCKPEEIVNDRAILSARLINNGKQIVFLTPVSVDSSSKYYNLESYDILGKKRTKLGSVKTSLKFPSGGPWNLGNPTFRVFEQSSLILFTEEISDLGENVIQNWKWVDVTSGEVNEFTLPLDYQWAPMMPVSYHQSSADTDVSAIEPYVVLVKPTYFVQGVEYSFKVIQLPERKTVLDFVLTTNSTLRNAIYIPNLEILNYK
jgi:hypothetical protein